MALPQRRADARPPRPEAGGDWRSLYEIENRGAVEAYVARHRFLEPLLSRSPPAIREHFGDHEGLRLEVITFPDEGDEHLYLYVLTNLPSDEATRREDRLDEDWWLDAMLEARARMTVGIELA